MSNRYNPNEEQKPKEISKVPAVPNSLCRDAFKWIVDENTYLGEYGREGDVVTFLTASSKLNARFKPNQIKFEDIIGIRDSLFDDFDSYKNDGYAMVHTIQFNSNKKLWLTNSICSCYTFQKDFTCKHIIGIAYRLKLKKCSQEADGTLISKKPTRGRIAKSKKALQRQN